MGPSVVISKKLADFLCRWCAEGPIGTRGLGQKAGRDDIGRPLLPNIRV